MLKEGSPHIKMKTDKLFGFVTFLFLMLSACNRADRPETEGALFVDLGDKGFTAYETYTLKPFEEEDSLNLAKSAYSGSLIIRYNENCKIQRLPLNVETFYNIEDTFHTSTLDIELFNNKDLSKGPGAYGVYQTEMPLFKDQRLDDSFLISLSTPEAHTSGILSWGISWTSTPLNLTDSLNHSN